MVVMEPKPVLKYTDFYKTGLPKDQFDLLRKYPTDLIILRLSKINSILFNEPEQTSKSQQEVFRQCFPLLSEPKREKVVAQLLERDKGKEITFFTATTIVKLINSSFQNYLPSPDKDELINSQLFEDDIFDSILIQNDLYYTSLSDDQNLETYEAIWHMQLMQQHYIRKHRDLFMIAPIKNFLFYKFMMKVFPGGATYINEFCTNLGIPSYFNYYFFFMNILQNVFNSYKEKEAKHIVDLNTAQNEIIKHFSIRPQDFTEGKYEGNIHKELMPKPFYFILDKHPVIIDFHFFEHVVDLALAHNFYNFSSLKGSDKAPTFSQFKSELGKDYYEGFILKEIFQKIYHAKNYTVLHAPQNSPLSDFTIVRNQREVLMIEVKSAEIHFNPLEDLDTEAFKEFLTKNFSRKKDKQTGNRGVYQLAKQIELLATTDKMNSILKDTSQKKKLIIYPVIIYLENALDMAGINSYLNNEFERNVNPFNINFRKIHPLTSINLNFFLRHYLKLKNNPALLFQTITSYTKFLSEKNKEYDKRPHPMSFFEKNISFDQFITSKFQTDDFSSNFTAIVEDLHLKDE
jgi:hypothetical protein